MNFELSLLNTIDCENHKENETVVLIKLAGVHNAVIDIHNRGLYLHTSMIDGLLFSRPVVMGVDLL